MTIPLTLSAGAYVEVAHSTSNITTTRNYAWHGTSGSPIYIIGDPTGASRPITTCVTDITLNADVTYVTVAGLELVACRWRWGGFTTATHVDHLSYRNNIQRDGVGTTGGGVFGFNPPLTSAGHADIISYANQFLRNGPLTGGADAHATKVGVASIVSNMWFVDNYCDQNGGDCIQIGDANPLVSDPTLMPHHVYVGRNDCGRDKENCVDIKYSRDVIVSSNYMHDYHSSVAVGGDSPGECIVVHNNPDNIWVIYNRVGPCRIGIISTGTSNFYVIGNVVTGVVLESGETLSTADVSSDGSAIAARGSIGSGSTWFVNNTLNGNTRGFLCSVNCTLRNNVVSGMLFDTYMYGFGSSAVGSGSTVTNNLVGIGTGSPFQAGATKYASIGAYGNCPTCVSGDPLFTDAASNDFTILTGSAAKDIGANLTSTNPYLAFFTRYGLSIEVDKNGTTRPQGAGWDAGAYEFH